MNICRLLFILLTIFVFNQSDAQLTYSKLKVEYDSAWTCNNLQLIPVKFKEGKAKLVGSLQVELPPLSFSDALQKHKIKLQEMQNKNGADVNWLQVINHSKQDVWIQSGEIVAGGKQDRMIAETKILEAGKTEYINVYCIEKRRWDDKPKEFYSQGAANSELRKTMDINGRQHEVWKEIDRQFSVQKKTSETFSYVQLFADSVNKDTACINYFTEMYRKSDRTFAGFVFITGDHIISCELFASPVLTDIAFNNLLKSYIHSAILNSSAAASADKLKAFMDKILTDEVSQKVFVTAHGKIHLSEGKIVHLVAYGD